jgi:hypothetical protein
MERIIMNLTDGDRAESSEVSTEEGMKRAVPPSSDKRVQL